MVPFFRTRCSLLTHVSRVYSTDFTHSHSLTIVDSIYTKTKHNTAVRMTNGDVR